ncbi:MAG: TonB-dependent receptor [Gammaproteobacteria bacterium]|nr:TonB-dependent receptor [Gammaproteobacteria bacterium]MYF67176.1 TonB-dependent receptor [Gammaproteobacteria bacterium]MYK36609.1 TonB-dependent receptor [Gammaproteobacteria bacterium]
MTEIRKARFSAVILGVCASALIAPVYAQELEEIVVVARKREESLQEVPISIATISAEDMEVQGIESLEDIARQTAGIIFDKGYGPQDVRVVMRGLSPTRGRPNVAVLLDDVDISGEAIRTAGSSLTVNPRLIDVERIEIVRGPQSALYGRSAFGGAIHYVTRRPSEERLGKVAIDVSAEGKRELTVSASGPVSDNFFVGFNAASWSEDGYYQNLITGADVGGQEGIGATLTAALDVSDSFRLTARVEITDDEFGPAASTASQHRTFLAAPAAGLGVLWHPDATGVDQPFGPVATMDELTLTLSTDPRTGKDYPGTTREVVRGHLRAELEFGGALLTSITHVGTVESVQYFDAQRTGDSSAPVRPFGISVAGETNFETETDLFSQEVRLSSTGEGPLTWVVGGLYWSDDTHQNEHSITCIMHGFRLPFVADPSLPISCGHWMSRVGTAVPRVNHPWDREISHVSAYGLVDWQFTDAWDVGFEARYVSEELEVDGPHSSTLITNAFGPPVPPHLASLFFVPRTGPRNTDEVDDSYLVPKLVLRYRPSDEQTWYGSISRGVKPAGISTLVGPQGYDNPEVYRFDAEEITVYEFGWKTSWMDNRLRFNGAVFYQDFSDKQLTTQYLPPGEGAVLGSRPENASAAKITGIEIDTTAVLTDNLTMNWGYTWLDSEYDEYAKLSSSISDAVRGGTCELVTLGNNTTCLIDLTGNEIEDVPQHQLFAGISWRSPMANGGEFMVDFDVQYQGSRYEAEWNLLEIESYMLADLRVGVSRGPWTAMLYVSNLFDDDTMRSALSAPDFAGISVVAGFVPPPRVPPPGRVFVTQLFPNSTNIYYPDPREFGLRASYTF